MSPASGNWGNWGLYWPQLRANVDRPPPVAVKQTDINQAVQNEALMPRGSCLSPPEWPLYEVRLTFAIVPYREEPHQVSSATALVRRWVKNRSSRSLHALRGDHTSNCPLLFLQLGEVLPAGVYVHGVTVFEAARYKEDAAAVLGSDLMSDVQLVWSQESSREPRYTCPGEGPGVLPWRH